MGQRQMGDIILPRSPRSHFRGVVIGSLLLIVIIAKSMIQDATPDAPKSVHSLPQLMRQARGLAAGPTLPPPSSHKPTRPHLPGAVSLRVGEVGAQRSVGCREWAVGLGTGAGADGPVALSGGQGRVRPGRQGDRHSPCPPQARARLPGTRGAPNPSATSCAPCRRSGPRAHHWLSCPLRPTRWLPCSRCPILPAPHGGPHWLRTPPGAQRARRGAARRRGRGRRQGAPGLASEAKGRDRPRRKQRARSPGAVPARSLRRLTPYAAPIPMLFVVFLSTAEPLGQVLLPAPVQREPLPAPQLPSCTVQPRPERRCASFRTCAP